MSHKDLMKHYKSEKIHLFQRLLIMFSPFNPENFQPLKRQRSTYLDEHLMQINRNVKNVETHTLFCSPKIY